MDTKQTNELTYTKVNEIDTKINEILDMVTDSNPENSTSLKEIANDIKSATDNLNITNQKILENTKNIKKEVSDTKINTDSIIANTSFIKVDTDNILIKLEDNSEKLDNIISNQGNQTIIEDIENNLSDITEHMATLNVSMDTLNNSFDNVSSTCNSLQTIIEDQNNNITTINSNTATIKSNVSSIQTSVKNIEDNIPSAEKYNKIDHKLNEILKSIRKNEIEPFNEDPYKLEMPYTGTIGSFTNTSNYAFIENTHERESRFLINTIAYTSQDTYSLKFKVNFTCSSRVNFFFYKSNIGYTYKNFEAGTHTFELNQENCPSSDHRIIINFQADNPVIVHYALLELFAENVVILNKPRKYKIFHSVDKIVISKVENNNGYYLELDKKNLTPELLKQDYVLDMENVLDYSCGYNLMSHHGEKYSLARNRCYISKDTSMLYCQFLDTNPSLVASYGPSFDCGFNFVTHSYTYFSYLELESSSNIYAKYKGYSGGSGSKFTLESGKVCQTSLVCDLNRFDITEKRISLLTNIQGETYILYNDIKNLKLGRGLNATAFYDINDPSKINVYMNDGGYCVKSVVQKNDDNTFTLLSQTIIGTYDAYFETAGDIYFVQKNEKLYMFKKTTNNRDLPVEIETNESSTTTE